MSDLVENDAQLRNDAVTSGRIPFPDRMQRLVLSIRLMSLAIWGPTESGEWKRTVALAMQVELLLTGLAGWRPFYWACSIASQSQ